MEISKPGAVSEELLAKSRTRSLDDLRKKGKDEVNVIRASDVTSMISETVNRVLRDTDLLSDEDISLLVDRGMSEFKRVFQERKQERDRIEQKFRDVQDELHTARARIAELEAGGAPMDRRSGDVGGDLMMRMMTEMAEMKANLAQAQQGQAASQTGVPSAPGQPAAGAAPPANLDNVANALDQISQKLNDRLEQFGKKMGISSAVEAKDVNYESLFSDADEAAFESNMGDVEVKKRAGGGIAGNLARLKKLKGGD